MELYHHGILGQKWGVRRFQNKDGSLKPAGEKRYLEPYKKDLANAKEAYRNAYERENQYGLSQKEYNNIRKETQKASVNYEYYKNRLNLQKDKHSLSTQKQKSKRQLALEEQYKKQGMPDDEAEIAAFKRQRVEKALMVAGAMTITAAAAYVAYKHYDDKTDRILKSGDLLARVTNDNNKSVHDAFYAAKWGNKHDRIAYGGMYGTQLAAGGRRDVFEKQLKAVSDVKIASNDSARKAFNHLMSTDKEFRDDVYKNLSMFANNTPGGTKQGRVLRKAAAAVTKENGWNNKKVYDAFNIGLANRESASTQKFYGEMRRRGYDAIKDMNDRKYSGYNSKTANIYINKGKFVVDKVNNLAAEDMQKRYTKRVASDLSKALGAGAARNAAIGGTAYGIAKSVKTRSDAKIVNEYRKAHPGTSLSYNEILRNEKIRKIEGN